MTRQDLDAELTPRTYAVGNAFTAADVALYGALHPVLVSKQILYCTSCSNLPMQSQLQPSQYYSHPAVTRYFDHIQTKPSVRKSADSLSPAFSPVTLDIENAPKQERKAAPTKEKKKAILADIAGAAKSTGKTNATLEATTSSADTGAPTLAGPEDKAPKGQKKEKKAKEPAAAGAAEGGKKKGAAGGGGKAAPAEDAGEPAPSMIDLRVGHIVESVSGERSLGKL